MHQNQDHKSDSLFRTLMSAVSAVDTNLSPESRIHLCGNAPEPMGETMTTLCAAVLRFTHSEEEISGQPEGHNNRLRTGNATEAAEILSTDPVRTHDMADVEILSFEAAICAPEPEQRLGNPG